jgi:hypothetical protein
VKALKNVSNNPAQQAPAQASKLVWNWRKQRSANVVGCCPQHRLKLKRVSHRCCNSYLERRHNKVQLLLQRLAWLVRLTNLLLKAPLYSKPETKASSMHW